MTQTNTKDTLDYRLAIDTLSDSKFMNNREVLKERFNYMLENGLIPDMVQEERINEARHFIRFRLDREATFILKGKKNWLTSMCDYVDKHPEVREYFTNHPKAKNFLYNLALAGGLALSSAFHQPKTPGEIAKQRKYDTFNPDSLYKVPDKSFVPKDLKSCLSDKTNIDNKSNSIIGKDIYDLYLNGDCLF